jgi:hypothetical protein
MFLLVGTFFLAAGIIYIFYIYLYKHLPKILSYIITFAVSMVLIFTATVHGIWLGLTILIVGFILIRNINNKSVFSSKKN